MDTTAKTNLLKIVVIPLVIALGLIGLGVAIFEQVTGIGPAISAYREGEEKCRKYGIFATAQELNLEYNDPAKILGGAVLQRAVAQYAKEVQASGSVSAKLNLSPVGSTQVDEYSQSLLDFWTALEPFVGKGSVRIPRDFRKGYAMLFPEYAYIRRVCLHSLNSVIVETNPERQIEMLSRVGWLRRQMAEDIAMDFSASLAGRILTDEMDTVRVLIKRRPTDRRFVELGQTLLKSEPVPTGIDFRLKADLHGMMQVIEPDYPIEKVLTDLGLRKDDPQWANWLKWRRYPRSHPAWKSTAMDIVSFGYEELRRNPPKNLEQYSKFRELLDNREMRFGYAPAVGWSAFHLIGIEDPKPFRAAQTQLRKEIAKHP